MVFEITERIKEYMTERNDEFIAIKEAAEAEEAKKEEEVK